VAAAAFSACLQQVAADESVDALVAIGVRTALADLRTAITSVHVPKPMATVLLDQPESVRLLRPGPGHAAPGKAAAVPAYAYPESAVRAIGHAADYQAWRVSQRGRVPELEAIDPGEARSVVSGFLASNPGGWLPEGGCARLLAAYQIPLVASRLVTGSDEAVRAAAKLGWPVVVSGS
jgi:acyl-CoA synthetase (NDP forming)